ncbi:hypothetical protein IWW34DRAFT_903216 [Fusarium oxysporum f. sp. albedinis]|nr:hypothetical protein IWW34DRAFT_903216 [Fusarium oxysporum f. sp. albedinis]
MNPNERLQKLTRVWKYCNGFTYLTGIHACAKALIDAGVFTKWVEAGGDPALIIKGARAYFMQNILHDWEDKQASQILKYIPDAMEPGYSIVLVHQSIINSVKPLARGDDG